MFHYFLLIALLFVSFPAAPSTYLALAEPLEATQRRCAKLDPKAASKLQQQCQALSRMVDEAFTTGHAVDAAIGNDPEASRRYLKLLRKADKMKSMLFMTILKERRLADRGDDVATFKSLLPFDVKLNESDLAREAQAAVGAS